MTRPARRTALLCSLAAATALLPAAPVRAAEAPPPLRFATCPDSVPRPAAPERVECGRLSVPLDRHHPPEPRIEVTVSRVRASGTPAERRGILLVNPGGPGGSGLPHAVTKRAKLPGACAAPTTSSTSTRAASGGALP
ncbi:hypothetical protein ABZ281_31765 [Streptomyces sp. NPDC006265]|uniref:hypothetical protein n=1 Tax=Streptomyces sp. NPDC006265 TaxID=3156740 RepID=UPI0033A7207D